MRSNDNVTKGWALTFRQVNLSSRIHSSNSECRLEAKGFRSISLIAHRKIFHSLRNNVSLFDVLFEVCERMREANLFFLNLVIRPRYCPTRPDDRRQGSIEEPRCSWSVLWSLQPLPRLLHIRTRPRSRYLPRAWAWAWTLDLSLS